MIKLNEEYYQSPYYFYLKDKGDKIAVYFAVEDTITESRKNDEVVVVDKEIFNDIQKVIANILKSGKKLSKNYVHKILDSKSKSKHAPDGELGELVNPDGSMIGSSIPILNQRNLAKKTMDQTVRMTKSNQFPFVRIYYGENEEKGNNLVSEEDSMCPEHVSPSGKKTTMCPDDDDYEMNYGKDAVNEVDQSESFGFEETEDARTYDEASEIMDELGVEDPIERDERVKRFGFDPNLDRQLKIEKKHGECKNCFTKRRLAEFAKQKVDEMLFSKKNKEKEIVNKNKPEQEDDSVMSKLLIRNIEAIKRLADKENISIEKLVKHLKQGE